uniref:Uncharacterized protein n=1 Tax=uncultured Sphingobacteriia bacterium TaxID=246143 RepID=F4MM09_9BACT|nr:hypothetical protein S3_858_0001 [uncultured Sphingobacteriia bacterium]
MVATVFCRAIPPATVIFSSLKSIVLNFSLFSNALNSVLTPVMTLILWFLNSLIIEPRSLALTINMVFAP